LHRAQILEISVLMEVTKSATQDDGLVVAHT